MEEITKSSIGTLVASFAVLFVALLVVGLWYVDHRAVVSKGPVLAFVSGTEYNVGERGQVIVEARFNNGSSAIASNCTIKVWYPDKSLFLSELSFLSTADNQFIEFVVPNMTGVYEYQATCPLSVGSNNTVSKSFHVSEFQNETLTNLRRVRAVMTR
jgi:hypothetical protein